MLKKIDQKYLGILCILTSAFFFSLMNFFVRLSGDVPVMQKCFFRNIVASVFSFSMLMKDPAAFKTGKGHVGDLFARAIAGTIGIFGNFYALSNIGVADASILNKLSPFFAILFSIFVLNEKPKALEMIAVSFAFLGAMFVVKPSFTAEAIPSLAGMFGGMCAGLAYTFVRKMGKGGVNGNLIIFFFSAFSCLVTLPNLIFNYFPMTGAQLACLLAAGATATGGQVFVTKAYTFAPAKQISVYDYSIVLFAAIWGGLFLAEFPDWLSLIGYVVIIGAAIVNWGYNRIRDREQKTAGKKL